MVPLRLVKMLVLSLAAATLLASQSPCASGLPVAGQEDDERTVRLLASLRRNPRPGTAFDLWFAGALEGGELVEAADVGAADEDLRDGEPPGALDHRLAVALGLVLLVKGRFRAVLCGGAVALGFMLLGCLLSWPASLAYLDLAREYLQK